MAAFSAFARGSSYIIFSVRSLFKSYFLGVRSEFNTHNPAICQAYFLPLPHQNLTIGKLLYLYIEKVRYLTKTLPFYGSKKAAIP